MAEQLNVLSTQSREEQYKNLIPQIDSLINSELDLIANMANISAALMQTFKFLWVGFYLVKGDDLVLGPFQGKIACTRIHYGKGVCGTAWKEQKTQIVADVDLFPGHIACDAESISEIVVPIIRNNEIVAVLDVDSQFENYFSETDSEYLYRIIQKLKF